MKLATSLTLAGLLLTTSLPAATLYQWDFTDSTTFPLGETVNGKEGWTSATIDSGQPSDAAITSTPSGNALRIYSSNPGAGTGDKRTTLRNNFTQTTSSDLYLRINMGWEWSGVTDSQSAGISLARQDWNTPFLISFSTVRGIRAVAGSTTTLLAPEKVKQGYIYQFDAAIDYDTGTFSITITGLDADDNPIQTPFTNLAFGPGASATGINGLFAYNYRGNLQDVLIQNITIASEPIPEVGSTTALLLGAGLIGTTGLLRKRRTQP